MLFNDPRPFSPLKRMIEEVLVMTQDQPFTARHDDDCVYLELHPDLLVSGRLLTGAQRMIRDRFGIELRVGVQSNGRIVVQLPGGSRHLVAQLAGLPLFGEDPPMAIGETDQTPFVPEVRYIHEGRAYLDPGQLVSAVQLEALVSGLQDKYGGESPLGFKRVLVSLMGETLAIGITLRNEEGFVVSRMSGKILAQLFPPAYQSTSVVQAGISRGQVFIRLRVPSGFDLASSGVWDLAGVLADPAPTLTEGEQGDMVLWVGVQVNPAEPFVLWERAAAIALHAGVHPVGDFVYRGDRVKWTLTPEPLSKY